MGNVVPLRRKAPRDLEPLWREALGEQLRVERRERGERIADVAKRAGVSPQYLSEVERGARTRLQKCCRLCRGALGLSVLQVARRASAHLSPRARGPVCLAA